MCYRISDMGLCRVEKGVTYTLQDFRDIQFQQLQRVSSKIFKVFIILWCFKYILLYCALDYFAQIDWFMMVFLNQSFGCPKSNFGHLAVGSLTYCVEITFLPTFLVFLICDILHNVTRNFVRSLSSGACPNALWGLKYQLSAQATEEPLCHLNWISLFFQQIFQVASSLAEFRELVKEVVRSACRTTLLEAGFVPDENNEQYGPTYSGSMFQFTKHY